MPQSTKKKSKRKRGKRGMGRLYKRLPGGKEYPADSPVNAPYWFAYTIPAGSGGKAQRRRVALHDEDGEPITDRKNAEAERLRIIAPFLAKDRVETERQIAARVREAEDALSEANESAAPPLAIANALNAYLDSPSRPDSGTRTLNGYASQFNRFALWISQHCETIRYMRDVQQQVVREYVKDLELAKVSPSTFNQHIRTLTRFWDVLKEEARTDSNPWQAVKAKTVDKIERRKRALTIKEASAVIEAAEGELRDMLILVACTGQRLVDVCKLDWRNVDLDAGVIEIYPQKTRRRKPEPVFVPILPHARAVLESRQKRKGLVFPGLAADYDRDNGSALTKRIQATIGKAGLDTHQDGTGFETVENGKGKTVKVHTGKRAIVEIGAHSLRHTFNTLARAAGIPDAMVKKITGHTTDAMTDHYTQFDKALVAKLSDRFSSLPPVSDGKLALPRATSPTPPREPLPEWAMELVFAMDDTNWESTKTQLLTANAG